MISEAIVHIGLHKTGSTSIQQSLANFDNGEIFYADFDFINHSIPIYTAFHHNYFKYHVWVKKGYKQEEIDELRKRFVSTLINELNRPDHSKIIISGEDISLLDDEGAGDFIELIQKHVRSVKIICYVRDPQSYAASVFQELVKHGIKVVPQSIYPDYEFRIRKFVELVGKENVIVRVFDPASFPKNSVVADFCDISGIPYAGVTEKRVNESLSSHGLKLLYLFNKTNPLNQGDASLQIARQKLLSTLLNAYSYAPKIEASYFSELIDYKDVDYLKNEFGITFVKADIEVTANNNKLNEWLNNLGGIDPKPLLKALDDFGIKGNFNGFISLLNRLFYHFFSVENAKNSNDRTLTNDEIVVLRDVAIKYESKQNVTKEEAITLMRLASRERPNAIGMKKKLEKWTVDSNE